MGRNIWSVCHECKSRLMHFRGQESDNMQAFQKAHQDHEKATEMFEGNVKEAQSKGDIEMAKIKVKIEVDYHDLLDLTINNIDEKVGQVLTGDVLNRLYNAAIRKEVPPIPVTPPQGE